MEIEKNNMRKNAFWISRKENVISLTANSSWDMVSSRNDKEMWEKMYSLINKGYRVKQYTLI